MLFLTNADTPLLMQAPVTLVIVLVTIGVSWLGFNNKELQWKLIFNTEPMQKRNEWYRFFSSGLIHADVMHLAFNMYALWEFGRVVEGAFVVLFEEKGLLFYITMYVLGLGASSVYSFFRHRDNPYYNALGASGAVSAVVFSYILLAPTAKLSLLFLPIPFPAYVFGLLYLLYSQYMSRKGGDNIGHDAHFWGSIWGIGFTLMLAPELFTRFMQQVFGY
jgi:membrane associated rhomboid family serine protease